MYIQKAMVITWDERKRAANIKKHGLDFADLTLGFFEHAVVYPTKQSRFLAVGLLGGAYFSAVVFSPLGTEGVSIISMRPASKKERDHARKNA